MARKRSPSAPIIPLMEAIERVEKVYGKEGRHEAPQEDIAQHMGYSGLTGRSLGVIAALRAYGLVEGRGALSVTADAVTILTFKDEPTAPERIEALYRCAFKPDVFEALRAKYGDEEAKFPPGASTRHFLINEGFTSKSADDVIAVYRENLKTIGGRPNGYNESEESYSMVETPQKPREGVTPPPRRDPPPLAGPSLRVPVFVGSEGRFVLAEVGFGEPITLELMVGLRKALASLEPPDKPNDSTPKDSE